MQKKVLEFIKANNLLQKNDHLVLGLSGGADSVCLFTLLRELKEEYSLSILAVHINHMIRETASRDEEFASKLCQRYQIKFVSFKTDCPAVAKRDGISLEEAGRNERYRLFNEAGKEEFGEGNFKIAVAHHMVDLAETLIFNMTRGTGINGLSSVKAANGNIIRPLLCVTREEIENYLKIKNERHVEDETNASDEYARNKIRHAIIPALNEITPNATNHLASLSERLSEIEDYLSDKTNESYQKYVSFDEGIFIKNEIKTEHPAIMKRVIHRALVETAGRARDISSVQIEAVKALFSSNCGKKRDLIYNIEAIKEKDGVRIRKKNEKGSDPLMENEKNHLSWKVGDRDFSQNIPDDLYTKWFDYDKIESCLNVRFRKTDDYLVINDKGQKKSLKEYMINEKIPADKRDSIVLLTDGNHVLWVVGYRISSHYKVSPETKRVLIATYK